MKRDLEELSLLPGPQRRPVPSDAQDVLKEMEDLRKQFSDAEIQHAKALKDLDAERALEVSQLRETHETLLSALTAEKDAVAESLKVRNQNPCAIWLFQGTSTDYAHVTTHLIT